MKNFLVALLVFLVWSVIGLWIYSFGTLSDFGKNEPVEKISEIKTTTPIVVKDTISIASEIANNDTIPLKKKFQVTSLDKKILFESDQFIAIDKDSSEVNISNELSELPSIITSYLLEHPGQELHITSYYSPSAKLQTPNIGEQRGDSFKRLLINEGADENQLVVKPVLTTTNFDADGTLKNAMTFSFRLLDRERIANHKNKIPDLITFYPTYNFDEVISNRKLIELSDTIVSLSEAHPELIIKVTGHTDHIGADSENYIRGLKSARQIRWFLVTKGGIDRKNIIAQSRGETEPIIRDGKPASRAENARIVIEFLEKE